MLLKHRNGRFDQLLLCVGERGGVGQIGERYGHGEERVSVYARSVDNKRLTHLGLYCDNSLR